MNNKYTIIINNYTANALVFMNYPSEFYFSEKQQTACYSHKPQGHLDVSKLIKGQAPWKKMNLVSEKKKKSLVLMDWTAANWSKEKIETVKNFIKQLINDDFPVYLWVTRKSIQLTKDTLSCLDGSSIRSQMKLDFQKEVKTKTVQFHHHCDQIDLGQDEKRKKALSLYKQQTIELALQGETSFKRDYNALEQRALAAIDGDRFTKVARTMANIILTALAVVSGVGVIAMAATSKYRGGFLFIHGHERTLEQSSTLFKDKFPSAVNPPKI